MDPQDRRIKETRTEIRDGRVFTVHVLAPQKPQRIYRSTRKCGQCGMTGKTGPRWRIYGDWVRCPLCVRAYAKAMQGNRDLDEGARVE